MTFGNMLLSPGERLDDLFKKNPDGVTLRTIADILNENGDRTRDRIRKLNIGTTKTGKDRKKYIHLTPEGVELLVQSFAIVDNTKESTKNIISEGTQSSIQPFAMLTDKKESTAKIIKTPKLAEETRMICRNAMKKYGITKWQWTDMTRSHASLFAPTHIRSILVYYVIEENIKAFEEVVKAKKELKSKSKNNIK